MCFRRSKPTTTEVRPADEVKIIDSPVRPVSPNRLTAFEIKQEAWATEILKFVDDERKKNDVECI